MKARTMRWAEYVARGSSVIRTEFNPRNVKREATGLRLSPEDNNKLQIKEMRWGSINWIHMAQDRDQYMVITFLGSK
jgi:hypothetical protein